MKQAEGLNRRGQKVNFIAPQYATVLAITCVGLMAFTIYLIQKVDRYRKFHKEYLLAVDIIYSKEKTLDEYRKTSALLVHKRPFISDDDALKAIKDAHKFDVEHLKFILDNIKPAAVAAVAHNIRAKGYRDIYISWLSFIKFNLRRADCEIFAVKIVEDKLKYLENELSDKNSYNELLIKNSYEFIDSLDELIRKN